jgi:hypothetical protein
MSDVQIFDCAQNSSEWLEARRGIPTASRFADILAKGQGITRRKYLYTLAGEVLTGEVQPAFTTEAMERGHAMEADAVNLYAFERDVEPVVCGFMRRGRAGCSPDRLLGRDGLVEVKSKLPHLQLEVLERGALPPEHKAQVQGQLWVSGRAWCDFISYWPRLPLFVTRVERDEPYIESLAQAVADFVNELDALVKKYAPQELEKAA